MDLRDWGDMMERIQKIEYRRDKYKRTVGELYRWVFLKYSASVSEKTNLSQENNQRIRVTNPWNSYRVRNSSCYLKESRKLCNSQGTGWRNQMDFVSK